MLTRMKEIANKRELAEKRRISNEGIRIYNTRSGMRGNPYSGDTTVLTRSVDNRKDVLAQTEDDVLDALLHPRHNFRVRKSDVKLVPDMVSDEIKDLYLQKIRGSALRSAINKRDKC